MIDDNQMDLLISVRMLRIISNNSTLFIHSCYSGLNFIEYWKSLLRYNNLLSYALPIVACMDIDMPIVDGHQLAGWISDQEEFNKSNCKIIFATSSIKPSDLNKSMKFPFVISYFNKPLTGMSVTKINELCDLWN